MGERSNLPAAWELMLGLWRDKWIILVCLAVGIALGFMLVVRPESPRFSAEISLDMTGRFTPRDEVFNQFRAEWQRSPLWTGSSNVSASIQYDQDRQAATIRLITSDAGGREVASYKQELQALIDKFEASVADNANLQLRELQALREMPGAGANDYIASTIQQMRLSIADATENPGLMALREVKPLSKIESGNRGGLTFILAAALGAIMGVLLSIARMIWAAAGRYAQDEQTKAASLPEQARPPR